MIAGFPNPRKVTDATTADDSLRNRPKVLLAPRAYVFVMLEGNRPLSGGARYALEGVTEIVVVRGGERGAVREISGGIGRLTLRLPSPVLSSVHARLRRAPDGWLVEDAGSKNGSYVNGRPVERAHLGPDDLLEVGHVFLAVRDFVQPVDDHWPDADAADFDPGRAGLHSLLPPLQARLDELARIASSRVTVLLWGETGTGKEVLSRAIHALSGRSGPFVAVNCSTLIEGLAESQLFGHVRGAFSGAVADTAGLVRTAEGGTLLLDEVGDLAPPAQGTLLRVLQEQEVTPVGGGRARKVDVRFIATSPRPLDPASRADKFRSDLFARLSGFVHEMTPLRRRREDTGLLVAALLRKAGVGDGDQPRMSPKMALALLRHPWPLNVRELDQALVRSWLLADRGVMSEGQIGPRSADGELVVEDGTTRTLSPADADLRRRLVEQLTVAHGNVSRVARALGKGRVHLHRLMKRLDVDPKRFRT
jgi:transcriptional regulator with AAA-type ATPase domain